MRSGLYKRSCVGDKVERLMTSAYNHFESDSRISYALNTRIQSSKHSPRFFLPHFCDELPHDPGYLKKSSIHTLVLSNHKTNHSDSSHQDDISEPTRGKQ